MTDTARGAAGGIPPLPDLFFYTRDGCHLCDEARDLLALLLAERAEAHKPVPHLVERDIDTNDDWLREHFSTIPVIELAGRRLELAVNASRIRRLFDEVLDTAPTNTPA
jgi:hypothetical protein